MMNALSSLWTNHYREGWNFTWYEQKNAVSGTYYTYNFTVPQDTVMYIELQLYNPRMYPYSCKTSKNRNYVYGDFMLRSQSYPIGNPNLIWR